MISLSPIPTLPSYPGPYKVGSTEYEIPVSTIPSTSPRPDDQISTLKFRLFYPTVDAATSKQSILWLPQPQSEWKKAYASFLGATPRMANWVSCLLSIVSWTAIPAVHDGALYPRSKDGGYPVAVFSHGLGGNFNTYSSICGALASCGIVCAAPEHRDGSAPTSIIRSADGKISSQIPYQRHSHAPSQEVLGARNAQLRIRLWELELLYTTLTSLNAGKSFTNYAALASESSQAAPLANALDLSPGKVTWAGHSFGACSVLQFVKSVYYHQSLPSLKDTPYKNDPYWQPIYTPAKNHELVKQITPGSPLVLLDLWTMPLRSESTKWLWDRPLPCYDSRSQDTPSSPKTSVISIMSTEFFKWDDLRNRTKAVLSSDPVTAMKILQAQSAHSSTSESHTVMPQPIPTPSNETHEVPAPTSSPDTDKQNAQSFSNNDNGQPESQSESSSAVSSTIPTPSPSITGSLSSSTSSLPLGSLPSAQPALPVLFHIPDSAHLSQSDFGVLFPRLTKWLMKAQEPEETILLNIRAITAVMRASSLDVARIGKSEEEDRILSGDGVAKRLIPLDLPEI